MITDGVSKEFFIKYLEDFSQTNPNELKIIVIDNASFHSTKDIELPKNIMLLPIPPFYPELNPAEKMWQWMKDKIAMKIYDNLETLEDKIEQLVEKAENQIIKSITGYKFYLKTYSSVFKG